MAVEIQSEEGRTIRQLIPLSTLPADKFAALCAQVVIESAEDGKILFRRGDGDRNLYYLLDGAVSLQTDGLKIETIKAGSDSARFAIAHQIPRKVDAIANGKIQFLRLDASKINSIQDAANDENESFMMVEELEDGDDWMTTLLKSPIFRGLPPANLQKILISLEEVSYQTGEIIIRQGEPGDFYYIIKKGQALISRKPTPNAKDIKLAQLGSLDTFGEDSLLSGEPRNVTITALTDISLLRLGKEQFINLIKNPTIKYIGYQDAMDFMDKGADLIDVRGPDEFKANHLPGSINVPIFSLRMYLKTLNRQHPIVVVCNDGRASETAAFILLRHKYTALVLRGGIGGLTPEQLKRPASFRIDDGKETVNFAAIISEPESQATAEYTEATAYEGSELRQVVQQLTQKCKALEADKLALELKCTALSRQVDGLKADLEVLKGGG